MGSTKQGSGLVLIYTGNGKGKTTAALGLALRAIGHGRRVCFIQFMKGSKVYGEIQAAEKFLPDLVIIQSGLATFVNRENPAQIDRDLAKRGLAIAREAAAEGKYDLMVLDEINVALDYQLLSIEEVTGFVTGRPAGLDLVLTGRSAAPELIRLADLVSEVTEIKHHYHSGVTAREGIEF